MDLNRYRHLLALAETRSFSRAAELVRITQPALSRSIAAFEAQHGTRLFDRARGGVVPTSAGRLAVEHARSVLEAAREFDNALSRHGSGELGELSFGIGPLAASVLLPLLVPRMLAERPKVRLRSAIKSPASLLDDLLGDRIELFFGNMWQLGEPDIEGVTLGTISLSIYVRAGHPLASRPVTTMADLAPFPAASAVDRPSTGLLGLSGAFICDNYDIVRKVVLESDCVWLASRAMVAADIAEKRLVSVEVADLPLRASEISLVQRRGRTLSPLARAAIGHVRAILSDQ